MAFTTNNISSLADIPALVAAAAALAGWATSGAGTTFVLTRPGGGAAITLSRVTGPNLFDSLHITAGTLGGQKAVMNNIRMTGTALATPTTPAPTRLFLFTGAESGAAFIAGAVEFGVNRFRHFYIGNMVKIGNYTGGEAVSAVYGHNRENPASVVNFALESRGLFNAYENTLVADTDSGFVNAVHADNPNPVLKNFLTVNNFDFPNLVVPGRVFGGTNDRVSGNIAMRGVSHFDAANYFAPAQLFATVGSPIRVRPLGHPAGLRMINMQNYDAGQQVLVGSVNWRVFPMIRKSTVVNMTEGAGSLGFLNDESSLTLGYAYPENI